jgi:hypothetical protein
MEPEKFENRGALLPTSMQAVRWNRGYMATKAWGWKQRLSLAIPLTVLGSAYLSAQGFPIVGAVLFSVLIVACVDRLFAD